MFWRLLVDSIVRRKSRRVVATLAVWIGISLIVGLLTLSIDVGDKMNLELRSFGANIKVLPVASSIPVRVGDYQLTPSMGSDYLEEGDIPKLKKTFWRNNIMGIVPRLWANGELDGQEVKLLGIWFEHEIPVEGGSPFLTGARQIYKHWNVKGNWPLSETGNECLIGEELARRLNVSIGNQVEVKTATGSMVFKVSGTLSTGDREEEAAIIAPLKTVQMITNLKGKASNVDVSALTTPENKLAEKYRQDPKSLTPAEYERWSCTPYPGSVAAEIQKTIPNSVAQIIRRVSETQGVVLTRIKGLMFLLAILTLVACCLSVMGILTSAVLERRPEVALLQAIGAHRSDVLVLFLVEASILGIIGGTLAGITGSWIGQWLVRVIFNSEPNAHLASIMLSPFLGLVIAWLGSLWPVWQALNQDIAQVLHGN